ncbi:MAG: ABC transporter substrate-binding protein [Pseudomonadales bacterium]|nr:ABC transporter substrate-binding protein [Pseudomonadales bacterium]
MLSLFHFVFLTSIVIWVTACSPVDNSVLKFGANNWLGYQPFYTAQSMGMWDVSKISVVELGSSVEVLRALNNGALDGAALTLDETIAAIALDKQLKIVMVIDFSYGGDALIVAPGISRLDQLKGKRIAVENTAVGALFLNAALQKAKLNNSDVDIHLLSVDQQADAMDEKQVDAVVTFEPLRSKLLSRGYRDLFSSREIPGRIVDVLVVSQQVADKYPKRIDSMLRGFFRARQLIVDQDRLAMEEISKRVGLNREAVLLGFEQLRLPDVQQNKNLMAQCDTNLMATAKELTHIMVTKKIINRSVSLQGLCDPQFINGIKS